MTVNSKMKVELYFETHFAVPLSKLSQRDEQLIQFVFSVGASSPGNCFQWMYPHLK